VEQTVNEHLKKMFETGGIGSCTAPIRGARMRVRTDKFKYFPISTVLNRCTGVQTGAAAGIATGGMRASTPIIYS
jgi:hypothetical protein